MKAGEITFGLSALLHLLDNSPWDAIEDLRRSEELSKIMQRPHYNAILLCIKATLKKYGHPILEQALPCEEDHYLAEAQRLFESFGMYPQKT